MRLVILSAIVSAIVLSPAASAVFAQTSNATFTVLPLGPTSVNAGVPVMWNVKVEVTGDNQGLAAWAFDLDVRDASGALIPNMLTHELTISFNVGYNAGGCGATFRSGYLQGGPHARLRVLPTQEPGRLIGFGGAYASPWSYTPKADRMTPGIGRPDRAADMLIHPADGFILHQGLVDTTGLLNGTYTVGLHTVGTPLVLTAGLDLQTNQVGDFTTPLLAGEFTTLSTFTFDVVPEPATLLLLAGAAGVFVLRRRGA